MNDLKGITIAASEIKGRLETQPLGELVDRLKFAMLAAKSHWLVTEEDARFRAAVAAVMLLYGDGTPEYERLVNEMQMLQRFNAAMAAATVGVGVDFTTVLPREDEQVIGLIKLWHETKV